MVAPLIKDALYKIHVGPSRNLHVLVCIEKIPYEILCLVYFLISLQYVINSYTEVTEK